MTISGNNFHLIVGYHAYADRYGISLAWNRRPPPVPDGELLYLDYVAFIPLRRWTWQRLTRAFKSDNREY